MEIWKLFLVTVVSAIAVGCIAGIIVGKHLVNRANTSPRPLFTPKQRIVLFVCLGAGILTVVLGALLPTLGNQGDTAAENPGMQTETVENGVQESETNPLADADIQADNSAAAGEDEDSSAAQENPVTSQETPAASQETPAATPRTSQDDAGDDAATEAVAQE